MRLAVDAMGGDHAPKEIVLGAMDAASEIDSLEIVLYGDENKIKPHLNNTDNIDIVHTEEVITGEDEPVRAVRRKKNASLVLMAEAVKKQEADACVSAGNTGALMSAGLFVVGRIRGIDRPALSPTLPTIDGNGVLLLDAGANVDAKPEHLMQYAILGSIYAEKVRNIEKPRVALLNVGTEEGKGQELAKQAYDLIKEAPVHFIGNIEGRDLLEGAADVIVADGFSGNIALKTIEGTAGSIMSILKEVMLSSFKTKIAAGMLKNDLKGLKTKLDYSEYGGAGLLGLAAPVIKAHGSSKRRAVYNAIKQAAYMVENDATRTMKETIASIKLKGE